jgi:cytochrome P450
MRFEPSLPAIPRTTTTDIDVAGETLAAGSLLFLSVAAANREPAVWTDPDSLHLSRFDERDGRPAAPRMLSFGAGPHYCLGAALARITLEEAVATLATGPSVTAAEDPWQLPWRSVLGRSPERLPVAFG